MNTKANQEAGVAQPIGSPSVSRKKGFVLVVGWVAAGFALFVSVMRLVMHWDFLDWSPKLDVDAALCGAGVLLTLAGIWFLSKATRDVVSQIVSALVDLVLAGCAVAFFLRPEPTSGGWLGRSDPSPWWFRGGCFVALALPAAFWLWNLWLPETLKAARVRIVAALSCILILAGAVFDRWHVQRCAEKAANAPMRKDFNSLTSEAIVAALRKGGPASKPDPKAWQRIHIGLSREEVMAILGQPATKTKSNSPDGTGTRSNSSHEWWEYGYSSPIGTGAVDPRAYALFFDGTGHVTSFQEPSESDK